MRRGPLTWACECGQMNLLSMRECASCAGDKHECWDREDRSRAVFVEDRRTGAERIIGFDDPKKP